MNKSTLVNYNGLSHEGGRAEFVLNLRASLLNTYRKYQSLRDHLTGQYL